MSFKPLKFQILNILILTLVLASCTNKPILSQSDLIIENLEEYTLEGIITGTKLYCLPWGLGKLPILKNIESFLGWNAEVMPVDIAVVTAPYNDPKILDDFYTIMRSRYAWVLPKRKESMYPPREHITNNHLLSSNDNINKKIRGLKAGQQIKITGHLVKITYPNGTQIVSSQTRYDTGHTPVWDQGTPSIAGGACEVILVNSIQIKSDKDPKLFDK